MQPVLEDDALLFSLDDVLAGQSNAAASDVSTGASKDQVAELEEELSRLRLQFSEYRSAVEKTLDERWTEGTDAQTGASKSEKDENHQDPGYFDSYSYNGESSPWKDCIQVTNISQIFTRLCCKTLSVPTRTATSSTATSISSPERLSLMSAAVRESCPCSAPKPVQPVLLL